MVVAVGHVDISTRVHGQAMWGVKLARARPVGTPGCDEDAVAGELLHSAVTELNRVDVSFGVDGDIIEAVELAGCAAV